MGLSKTPILLVFISSLIAFAQAQDGAACGVACDTYNTNLENTAAIFTTDVENPFQPITGGDVLQMCGDFSEFNDYGSAIVCYQCGGFGGTVAQEQLLDDWALVCATCNENDSDTDAGAACWNSGLLQSYCGSL
jgi:hypothetical protein